MFYTVFASLGALCSLINSAPNHSFRTINRYNQSTNSYSTRMFMDYNANNVSFDYDNSSNDKEFLDLDTFSDYVYLCNENGSTAGTVSWYLTRPNNGTDLFFNLDTDNRSVGTFNLRLLISFSVYNENLDYYVYQNYFDIDFSKSDYEFQYHYIDDAAHEGFDLASGLQGYLVGYINISYVPVNETDFNNTGTYNEGFDNGYNNGYNEGYRDGNTNGYQDGYVAGFNDADNQDSVAVAIFSGIISVGLIPINFFLACLNFEVFGINIGAFVSALLTVAIVVIITRMIVSGGNGGDK